MSNDVVKMDVESTPNSNNNRRNRGRSRRGKKHSSESNNNNGPQKKRPKKSSNGNNNICFQFAKKGTCDRGEKCRFLHQNSQDSDKESNVNGTNAPAPAPVASTTNNNNNMVEDKETVVPSNGTKNLENLHITQDKFADLQISSESRRALSQVFKYEFMTIVQSETLPFILQGHDVLAKAKTGTGKTLGFLIPTVELIQKNKSPPDNVSCLVISPTRELAFQISSEATNLLTYHKNINVVALVGGTNINKDHKALKRSVDIVVATPGRLLDHLQNYGLAERMGNLSVLILDEADQLLDMGFRPDIERILKLLERSKQSRQTLLFSATIPKSVSEIARIALRPKYEFVDTVGHDEEQTHLHVQQQVIVVPQADQIYALASILARETSSKPYKIIVFFTTARLTGFMAELFNAVSHQTGYEVLEIHSRKSQAARKWASDKFRNGRNGVLFSSDVSARGMDYPDVTFVLQVGLTERAQYIHRLGRTARAGKQGKGTLLLAPYEERYMVNKELSDLPLEFGSVDMDANAQDVVREALELVSRDKALKGSAEQAYRAWLGYYNSNLKKCNWNKEQLVVAANQWAKDVGLKQQPRLQKKTVGKMGLKGVPGLLLE